MVFGTKFSWLAGWAGGDVIAQPRRAIAPGLVVRISPQLLARPNALTNEPMGENPASEVLRVEQLFSKRSPLLYGIYYQWPYPLIWESVDVDSHQPGDSLRELGYPIYTADLLKELIDDRLMIPAKYLTLVNHRYYPPALSRPYTATTPFIHGLGRLHKFVPCFWGTVVDRPGECRLVPAACVSAVLSDPTHEGRITSDTTSKLGNSHNIETVCMTITPCQPQKRRRPTRQSNA